MWTGRLSGIFGHYPTLPLAALELRIRLALATPDGWMTLMYRSNFVAVLTKIFGYSGRVLISEHVDVLGFVGSGTWRSRLKRFCIRKLYLLADNVLAVSHGIQSSLVDLGIPAERVVMIHNAIAFDEIKTAGSAPAAPRLDPPTFITVGRLCYQKDHPTLLLAAKLLKERGATFRVLVVGVGPDQGLLKRLVREYGIENEVELHGWTNEPYALIARCRGFVLSSRFEGFGLVLVEAMACGLPVISTDCPSGPAEILEGGRHGVLVPVGDAGALADAMQELLLDGDDRWVEKSRLATERAKAFDIGNLAPRYEALLLGCRAASSGFFCTEP
jgi:glycosyltransferase involved in cell wall biosynthesis